MIYPAIWTIAAVIGAVLMIAPRSTAVEVGRVARALNDYNPLVGELLLRLLGLALFIHFGLALITYAGLIDTSE